MIGLAFVVLVLASVLGPSFVDYLQSRKAERRRLDAWVEDVRRLQDDELRRWRARRAETRETFGRVA